MKPSDLGILALLVVGGIGCGAAAMTVLKGSPLAETASMASAAMLVAVIAWLKRSPLDKADG